MLSRAEITEKLRDVPPIQQSLFTARCALRVVPVLVRNGEDFPFWRGGEKALNIISIFRALNAAFLSGPRYNTRAYAATDDTYADAVAYAAYATTDATYVDAAYAADADADAYSEATSIDLENITNLNRSSPLWPNGQPSRLAAYEDQLIAGLKNLGLDYWVRQYQGWVRGQFDEQQMRRCLEMPESYTRSAAAMMGYLEATQQKKLAEARVLVIGDGGVGKSSLLDFLLDGTTAATSRPATPGVAVREQDEQIKGSSLRVHYWDFGGQLHLHPTHQFFMRERCVYIVVLNARRESLLSPEVDYWLEHVRLFGRDSATLIVQNKVDELPSGMGTPAPFDERTIRERYPFVTGRCLNLSCKEGWGREALQAALGDLLTPILDEKTPATWFDLKERLRQEPEPCISRAQYADLCGKAQVDPAHRQGALDALNNLGVALHFPEVDDDLYVLKPEWITDIVYHIIWHAEQHHWGGILSRERLEALFDRNVFPQAPAVRIDKLPAILRLLQKFELVYDIGQGEFCAPMLLGMESRPPPLPERPTLRFVVPMAGLLPPTLYYRFVTQCGQAREIDGDRLWRYGCLLVKGGVRVLSECNVFAREVVLTAYGDEAQAGHYMSELRQRLFRLCGSYEGLDYKPEISGNGFKSLSYKALLGSYSRDIAEMVDGEGQPVSVAQATWQVFGGLPTPAAVQAELAAMYYRGKAEAYERVLEKSAQPVIQNNTTVQVTQNVTQNLHLRLQIKSQLISMDSALDPLEYEIGRLKEKERLLDDIRYLREKIAELQALKPETNTDHTQKSQSLWGTIQRYAGVVKEGLKGVEGIADLAGQFQAALQALAELMK